MRVWIDLSNSPHPLLFAPIAARLEQRGHTVLITARDNAQTVALARRWWPDLAVVGHESPRGRTAKARAIGHRVRALRDWARTERPDVALSHNSYAQIVAARAAGIPPITAMDYEHQPANHLAFRLARTILLPEPLPPELVRRQGAAPRKVLRYPGLKEELYLGDFKPDPGLPSALGVPEGAILVVTRTPPARAIYHRHENVAYPDALRRVGAQPGVAVVALARHPEQRELLGGLDIPGLIVPEHAVDARSLMYAADLVLGAGGTMTREAALLGVPTLSLFSGRPAAVDDWLEQRGALERLRDLSQLDRAGHRDAPPFPVDELRRRGEELIDAFAGAVLAV